MKMQTVNLRLPIPLIQDLNKIATIAGVSRDELVRVLLALEMIREGVKPRVGKPGLKR